MTSRLRIVFACTALTLFPSLHAADKPAKETPAKPATADAKPSAPPATPAAPAATSAKPDDVITLPAVQVTRSRIRKIDVTIKRLDKLIARERKHLKSTETDRTLNNDTIANKAAFFGGYSTAQRTAVASERVRLLESERELLEQMKAPMTRDDFLVVEKQVEMLRTARRELDIVYR